MNSPIPEEAATTLDRLLGGRLVLRQPARGHRAGTDAVLLAAFANAPSGGRVVDLGAGVGTIGLILALRDPSLRVVLVERDPWLASLARENAAINGVADRVQVDERDVFARAEPRNADLVVCNPPFYAGGETRASPDGLRATAHHLGDRDHAAWRDAALREGRRRGTVSMIHRPAALPALLASGARRFGGVVLRPVHARTGTPAIRILLSAVIDGAAPLAVIEPLILHGQSGDFAPEADAAHQGTPLVIT